MYPSLQIKYENTFICLYSQIQGSCFSLFDKLQLIVINNHCILKAMSSLKTLISLQRLLKPKTLPPISPYMFSTNKSTPDAQQPNNQTPRLSLSENYQIITKICSPQFKKYMSNGVITLLHAGLFMYLPNIYQDINYLMDLKISVMSQSDILNEYMFVMGKWASVFTFMGIFTYWRRFDFLDISNRIAVRMRAIAFRKIMESQFYHKNTQFQTYMHHIITDIQTVSYFTGQTIFMGLRGLFFLLGGSACLLFQSPYICLIAAVTMGAFNLFYRPRNIKLKHLKQLQNRSLIDISEHISERLQNIRLIKICHTQSFEQYKLHGNLEKFYELSRNVAKANGFNYASLEALGLFSLFSIAACGSLLISFQISNFSLITSSTYALYVAMGFRSMVFFNTQLNKIMGVYKILQSKIGRIHEVPDYSKDFEQLKAEVLKEIQKIEEEASHHKIKQSKGLSVRFQNVDFHYELDGGSKHQLYSNYNLSINSGEIVALVGPSGVGKSTLFNLITKLSEPEKGRIYLDDMSLSLMNFSDIQQLISYVTQENFLFKGTVAENLAYGNQGFDCSEQNLINCLKLTNAQDFVMKKGGLSMLIEEKGKNISGGEKQRIILARALVKHPKLLLLDEATAGVDSASEQIIVKNLKNSRKDMTTIIITHKMDNFKPIVTKIIDLSGP